MTRECLDKVPGRKSKETLLIEVDNLTRSFNLPGGKEFLAVDHLSFRVSHGEVYGLLGPNGAGKTTTLRMLLGLLTPSFGGATIEGYHSSTHPNEVKRRVGLVSTSAGLYPHLSVREMLLFFGDIYGVPHAQVREQLKLLAHRFDLTELLDRRCMTLSTGQKQRVNLARALIHQPPVLLLDEPTGGLDILGSQVVAEYIHHLREKGKAVILTTHRLDEAERLCDRFGLLHRGRLVAEGTLEELRSSTGCDSLVAMFLKQTQSGPLLEHLSDRFGVNPTNEQ